MRFRFSSALAAVALSSALLLPAGAASATVSSASPITGSVSASSTAPNPSSSPSTPGPVDPGTGETPAAKQNRVDYAPYVIAAAVILALAAAALVWRRSKGGPSSRNLRHADKNTNEGGPDDRRSDH
ncbi:hypothetical protein [Arthrobacter sp. B3I4]|uniref:hypothetical protein n=1 Tax=Arthrobacter sp. B3I4 TaxID=3042267 RepID=UPI002787CC44|nr:hypothetical protein [Arthrobacter sp. B3I4]MDQ0755246.1 cobalamin biosynthesis Mg chelatase CobN [Arthrobacter sp. B3I4]